MSMSRVPRLPRGKPEKWSAIPFIPSGRFRGAGAAPGRRARAAAGGGAEKFVSSYGLDITSGDKFLSPASGARSSMVRNSAMEIAPFWSRWATSIASSPTVASAIASGS